jgi:hypothetical protein
MNKLVFKSELKLNINKHTYHLILFYETFFDQNQIVSIAM